MSDDYPHVECDIHGRQRAYLICFHVIERESPTYRVVSCTDTDMGITFCLQCWNDFDDKSLADLENDELHSITIMCEAHVREQRYDQTGTVH